MPIPLKASNGLFAGTFRSVHFPISKEQVQANTPMLAERFQQVTVDARVSPSRAIVWGVGGKRREKEIKRLANCFCALLQEYGQLLDDTQFSWEQCLG